ncbi:hypothetical protein [Paenibacillus sp. Mc5Re-14]|uniref:hypothetical protein n=1 Tax=Paenibacillus sp. Mc5Re-14 TaxID=1030529 RepID=UPI000ADDE15B|nr:hypothetical protein [Paenibacillus sp. Mc5Re-14]
MMTQYGMIEDTQLVAYLSKLINRVFKIIPMNEEQVATLEPYVDSLIREVVGNSKVFLGEELLLVCGTLKGLDYSNHRLLKSDVFKVIDVIVRAKERVM